MQVQTLLAALISLSLMVSAPSRNMSGGVIDPAVQNQNISVARNGSRPSQAGPSANFAGSVRIDPLFDATDSSRAAAMNVTFEPGARTAWHTHPRGQRLIVTAGTGRVQSWGGPVEEIRPGDVVSIAPGVKHWHGASPTTGMTHIAVLEHVNGNVVTWLEKVSAEQYNAQPHIPAGAR